MAIAFETLAQFYQHGFDTVIDVRSPDEFAEDHVPGAINLPVLSNAERAEVGTIYTQVSPFKARKVGAALVARNAADHISGPLAEYEGGWKPLVYCWRGGQRSGSFTGILQQIGWRAETVQRGYQSYRRLVHEMLYKTPLQHRLILLDGNTGTAKTAILGHLESLGVQVIDLEGLANHRGSLLGAQDGGQPSQKAFESALAAALIRSDPEHPIVVEAESSKVGQIVLPEQLWTLMKTAPRIEVEAPLAARADFLTEAYGDAINKADADPHSFAELIEPLRTHRGHAVVDGWLAHVARKEFNALAAALMSEHYDLSYAQSRKKTAHEVIATLTTETLDDCARVSLARKIAEIVKAFSER